MWLMSCFKKKTVPVQYDNWMISLAHAQLYKPEWTKDPKQSSESWTKNQACQTGREIRTEAPPGGWQ